MTRYSKFYPNIWTIKELFDVVGEEKTTTFPPSKIWTNPERNHVYIDMALAGWKKDQIKIEFQNGYLFIIGNHQEEDFNGEVIENRLAMRSFKWQRKVHPTLDVTALSATFENGMLHIAIPVKEESQPKEFSIQ
jgi:HSP20 family protein